MKCSRHTKGIPESYGGFHAFATAVHAVGYSQARCPDCKLWKIYRKRKKDIISFPLNFLELSTAERKALHD